MFSNLWRASRSVVDSGRASLLLHKDSFPLLPAARRLGQLSLRCLLSSHGLGELPLLPIVIGCGRTADVENNAPKNKTQPLIRGNYTLCSFDSGRLHSCGAGSDARNYRGLTVFGFGLDEAVLWALVGDEDGAEEVRAALELHAHLLAEIWDLVCQADDADGGAIGFPFISEGKEGGRDVRTLSASD